MFPLILSNDYPPTVPAHPPNLYSCLPQRCWSEQFCVLAGPPKQIFLADFPRLSSSWHSVQWTPATFVTHHIPHPELSAQCPQLHEVHREPLQFPLPQLAWKLTQGYKLEPSEGSPLFSIPRESISPLPDVQYLEGLCFMSFVCFCCFVVSGRRANPVPFTLPWCGNPMLKIQVRKRQCRF